MVAMRLLCSEQFLVLALLIIEPVGRTHVLRLGCLFLEPTGYRILELGLVAQALGERNVRRPKAVPVEQLPQRPQTLELGGAVDPVARPGAGRLDQAHGLQIPQHSRRPTGRLSGFIDRQAVQKAEPYHKRVKVEHAKSRYRRFLSPSISSTGVG